MELYLNFLLWIFGTLCSLGPSKVSPKQLSGLYTGPYFSRYTAGNVTVRAGDVAHLPCRVHQVRNYTVSWIRNRDSAILAIDGDTIVNDRRITIIKTERRGDWVLSVTNVMSRDDGSYECQVSMQKKMSQFVFLKVLLPTVSIDGPPEVFTKSGSRVQLLCHVANRRQSVPIIWKKDGVEVKDSSDVKMEIFDRGGNTTARLTMTNVNQSRFGVYSCQTAGLPTVNMTLHVIDAKEQGLRTNAADKRLLSTFLEIIVLFRFYLQ